jgi:hypothetical protein
VLEFESSLVVTITELVIEPVIIFSKVLAREQGIETTLATTKEGKDSDAAFADVAKGSICWRAGPQLNGLRVVVQRFLSRLFDDTDLVLAARSPSRIVRVLSLSHGYERHHAGDRSKSMMSSKFLLVSNIL